MFAEKLGQSDQREQMVEEFVKQAVRRIEQTRTEQGDEAWAQALGDMIVAQMAMIGPDSGYLAMQARKTLIALAPQLKLLHDDPVQGHGVAIGMIEELAIQGLTPLSPDELMSTRK